MIYWPYIYFSSGFVTLSATCPGNFKKSFSTKWDKSIREKHSACVLRILRILVRKYRLRFQGKVFLRFN